LVDFLAVLVAFSVSFWSHQARARRAHTSAANSKRDGRASCVSPGGC
jgi:hypothetical protein